MALALRGPGGADPFASDRGVLARARLQVQVGASEASDDLIAWRGAAEATGARDLGSLRSPPVTALPTRLNTKTACAWDGFD
jgi:hypothetical protein